MLSNLQVRNFAIIDRIEVDFDGGMTVLTGETGAGKSILVDALGLVLGERGGTGLVRDGAERAEFSAEFDLQDHALARDWLADQSLDADGQCIVRRVITADGRSRAFINGTTVTLQNLKSLGELLVDIHGQHFHQSLGRRDVQRELLDHFGRLQALRAECETAYDMWQSLAAELETLRSSETDRESRIDLLEFQLGELDALNLQADELGELLREREKLQNSGRIADGISEVLEALFDAEPDNAYSLLARSQQTIDTLSRFDKDLDATAGMLQDSVIQVSETADRLRRVAEHLDADPERREWVEERIDAIQTLARKHRVESADLGPLREQLAAQLDGLKNAEQRGEDLANRTRDAEAGFRSIAATLTDGRSKTARKFGTAVTRAMSDLGMPDGVFEVSLQQRAADKARAWGMEDVEYRISANAGQAPMSLARIASGGELSRMSLAIQVIASGGSAIPTMIFDEVDSGVGGGVAEMVGRRLRELAVTRQVLSVTHLPQVASQANHHLRINKISDGKSTRTSVSALREDERVEELARMLGGMEITRRTREHAAEMLSKGRGKKTRKASAKQVRGQ